MAKRKAKTHIPDSSKEAYECIKKGIKVYPIYKNGRWFICYEINGKVTRYDKHIQQEEINLSVCKTYIHLYQTKILKDGKV
jgi:hypothetical protein